MRIVVLLFALFFSAPVFAHVGSPNVVFEDNAGNVPIRVIIRPPGVVPGLAEIDVRTFAPVQEVAVLPIFWQTGRKGAPPPDIAELVRGETNLYHAKLWLMSEGAYSVEVAVKSPLGGGAVRVPVNSIATARNVMPRWFGAGLAVLGLILLDSAIRLAGAAFGESVIEPGSLLTRKQVWFARSAMLVAALIFSLFLIGGRLWWNLDDKDYRQRRLYSRPSLAVELSEEKAQPILRLKVAKGFRWKPLLPDHGKLMHVFLIKDPGQDAFAHLHPIQSEPRIFETAIPPLPGGQYRLYADVTHEDGTAETLTAIAFLPEPTPAYRAIWEPGRSNDVICSPAWMLTQKPNLALPPDADDSWLLGNPGKAPLPQGHQVQSMSGSDFRSGAQASLKFRLVSRDQAPVPIEPYIGMMGHMIVWRKDGEVFTHVHPIGNFSMASHQFFSTRDNHGKPPKQEADQAPASSPPIVHTQMGAATNSTLEVSFPYEFPAPGAYRIWVQLKAHENIFTGVFDADVR